MKLLHRGVAILLTGLVAGKCLAQTTAPSTQAADDSPAVGNSPSAVESAFIADLTQGDWDAASALAAADPASGALARAMIEYARQSRILHTAALARFGEADSQQIPDTASQLADLARQSTLATQGDSASLVLNNNAWLLMHQNSGQWRITEIRLGASSTATTTPAVDEAALVRRFSQGIEQTADKLKGGKYATMEELMKDFDAALDAAASAKP